MKIFSIVLMTLGFVVMVNLAMMKIPLHLLLVNYAGFWFMSGFCVVMGIQLYRKS